MVLNSTTYVHMWLTLYDLS